MQQLRYFGLVQFVVQRVRACDGISISIHSLGQISNQLPWANDALQGTFTFLGLIREDRKMEYQIIVMMEIADRNAAIEIPRSAVVVAAYHGHSIGDVVLAVLLDPDETKVLRTFVAVPPNFKVPKERAKFVTTVVADGCSAGLFVFEKIADSDGQSNGTQAKEQ